MDSVYFRVQARPDKAGWWVETRSSRSKVYRVERVKETEDKQVSGLFAASCRISEPVFLSEFLRELTGFRGVGGRRWGLRFRGPKASSPGMPSRRSLIIYLLVYYD